MKWIYELGVDELLPAYAINEYTCVVKFLSESRPDSLKSLWLVTGASRAFFQFVCLMKHWRHWHDRRICSVVFIKLGIAEKAGARVFRWRISWAWCDKDAGSEILARGMRNARLQSKYSGRRKHHNDAHSTMDLQRHQCCCSRTTRRLILFVLRARAFVMRLYA